MAGKGDTVYATDWERILKSKQPDGHYVDEKGNCIIVYSDGTTRDTGKAPIRRVEN